MFGKMRPRRPLVVTAAVVALSLIAAACGDDGGSDTSSSGSSGASGEAASSGDICVEGDTVELGFLNSTSGPMAISEQTVRDSLMLAAKEINAAGGILDKQIEFIEEDDAQLAEAIRAGRVERVRYAAPDRVPDEIRVAAAGALQYIADTPVSAHGRIELLWYFREQSISHVYHRYGNLGLRANEPRDEPA